MSSKSLMPWEMDWGASSESQQPETDVAPWEMDWGSEEKEEKAPKMDFESQLAAIAPPKQPTLTQGAQSLTFNFGDEIMAGTKAAYDYVSARLEGKDIDFGSVYEQHRQKLLGELEQANKENPVGAVLGDLTGAVLGGGVAIKGAGKVASAAGLDNLVQAVPNMLKVPAAGAAGGAAAAAGNAQPGERIEEAEEGAAWGAALGFLGTGVVRVGADAASFLKRKLGYNSEAREAAKVVADALANDNVTPEMVARQIEKLGGDGVLADVAGENIKGLARTVAASPGMTKNRAYSVLTRRALESPKRVDQVIKSTLGDAEDYALSIENLQNQRKILSSPLYQEAYQVKVTSTPLLQDLSTRHSFQKAWQEAAKMADNEGKFIESLHDITSGKPVSTRTWDYIKRGLDDIIRSEKDEKGRLSSFGSTVLGIKNQLVDEVDKSNPVYAEARKVWAGPTASINALEDGRNFLKEDVEITVKDIRKLPDGDKEMFRLGAARAIRDRILSAPDGSDAFKRIFGNPLMREKVRAVFPDDNSFRKFKSQMLREAKMARTKNVVLGGSPTARIEAEKAGFGVSPSAAGHAVAGQWGFAAVNQLTAMVNAKRRRMPDKVRAEIGNLLFKATPEQVRVATRKAWPYLSPNERKQMQLALSAGLGAQQDEIPGR